MQSCVVDSNTVAGWGGGITLEVEAAALVESCTVRWNEANEGGGIFIATAEPVIRETRFAGNRAESGGGARILVVEGPSFVGCAFAGNEATTYGGGLKVDFSTLFFEDCRIDSNSASSGGGALWMQESDADLERCLVRKNSSANGAGGVRVSSSTLLIRDGEIAGNGRGLVVGSPGPVDADARGNWWGHPSGPYHPALNPGGLGDEVSDHVLFDPWETPTAVGAGEGLFAPGLVAGSPVRSGSAIAFSLGGRRAVALRVYDVAGRLVRTLLDGEAGPGVTRLLWDGRDDRGSSVGSGVYLVRLATPDGAVTKRVVVVR
ncbi:MAG: right-handed parallel beta-helix repeat-containing protein [Candidatus Eisenbacteria bacterium]